MTYRIQNRDEVPIRALNIVVETEQRRLLARVRRNGTCETANYLAGLIRNGRYPMWCAHQFINYLLKHGELQAAEIVLLSIKRSGEKHFLIDILQARWFWSMGDRKKALRFTNRKAKEWKHSSLYNVLYGMYKLLGRQGESDRCNQMAERLAISEIARSNGS